MKQNRQFFLVPLATAALLGLSCSSGGGGGSSPTAPARVVTITITENAFNPRSITISAGDTVEWVFSGNDPTHTTTAMTGSWDSDTIFLNQGDVFRRTFTAGEDGQIFEYFCSTHHDCCSMQGSIRVGTDAPNPREGY